MDSEAKFEILDGGSALPLTLTMTSIENAVTASNHVEGAWRDHNADNRTIGATSKKAQTHRARMCRLRDGFRAALSDIKIGATILCKKCSSAVIRRQKFRHKRMKRFSGDSDVSPVCNASM